MDERSRELGREFAEELHQGRGDQEYAPDEVAESIVDAADTWREHHTLDRHSFKEGAVERWKELQQEK